MKKALLIGSSIFNPSYYNTRLYGDEKTKDIGSFVNIIEQLYQIPVKSLGVNATGNEWVLNGILSHLDEIDQDTLVIVMWASVDRHDMHFDNTKSNDELGFPRKQLLPPHAKHELSLTRTYNLKGQPADRGLRFWSTGPAMNIGIKKAYKSYGYSEPLHLKQAYEGIALVQNLLKGKCYKQKHIMPWDITRWREKDLFEASGFFPSCIKDITTPKYTWLQFPEPTFNLLEEYPELQPWKNMVDWSLFTKDYYKYFIDEGLPWYAGFNPHNNHQVPYNNYKFITSEIEPDPGNHLDYFVDLTIKHCREMKVFYPMEKLI